MEPKADGYHWPDNMSFSRFPYFVCRHTTFGALVFYANALLFHPSFARCQIVPCHVTNACRTFDMLSDTCQANRFYKNISVIISRMAIITYKIKKSFSFFWHLHYT